MTFFEGVNLAHVKWVEESESEDGGFDLIVHFIDGTTKRLEQESLWDLEALAGPVVPAYPGFYLLDCGENEAGGFWDSRDEIIAWRVGSASEPKPITARSGEVSDTFVILTPSGTVVGWLSQGWPSEDAWRAEVKEEFRKQRKDDAA